MKPIITFALTAVLTITFASCGKNYSKYNTKHLDCISKKTVDSLCIKTLDDYIKKAKIREIYPVPRDTCAIHLDTTFLCSIELDYTERRFYDLFLGGHYLIAFSYDKGDALPFDLKNMTIIDLYYDRYNDQRNFLDEGSCYPLFYYPKSIMRPYLYIVTCVCANSNGWRSDYKLFAVNCMTKRAEFLLDCAAIAVNEPYGFVVSQARLTNRETATCTAEQIWVMHDEFIDWDGNVKYVDTTEYDYETMDKKYLCGDYTYVKGFYGVKR